MTDLPINQVIAGDCLEVMRGFPAGSINLVMFSPPYWGLRDYGENVNSIWGGNPSCEHDWDTVKSMHNWERKQSEFKSLPQHAESTGYHYSDLCSRCGAWRGQLGLEPTYQMYIEHLIEVGQEIRRVLRGDGSWYLNLGDTFFGNSPVRTKSDEKWERTFTGQEGRRSAAGQDIKAKCKLLIPYRVALALIDDGWTCRNDITWYKPNAMPSSVKDRLNTQTERVFHLVKSRKYYYDLDAIRESHKTTDDEIQKGGAKDRGKQGWAASHLGAPQQDSCGGVGFDPLGKNPGDVTVSEQIVTDSGDFWLYQTIPSNDYWCPVCKNFVKQEKMLCLNCGNEVCGHFAVYPEALCERPIKSSCPVKVCVKCGMPYQNSSEIVSRYVKREAAHAPRSEPTKVDSTGWQPPLTTSSELKKFCNCDTNEITTGIILDPMCGSGTTLVVAKKLGRRFIGIDLNRDYVKMAQWRLSRIESPLEVFS